MAKRSKNANGQGTIFYRSRDKRWVVQVIDPDTGKRRTKVALTENKAKVILREMLNRVDEGKPPVDITQTVEQFAKAWLATQAGKRRAGTTVHEYSGRFTRYVYPAIGKKRMDKVTIQDIENMLDDLVAKGLSKGTVRAVKNALSAMFSDAKKNRVIARNPVRDAEMPSMQAKQPKQYPSRLDVQKLLAKAASIEGDAERELGRILFMCAHTGARIGEIMAAKWSDLDLEAGTWTVISTVTRSSEGKRKVGSRTKTGESRLVPLSAGLVQVLKLQQEYVSYVKSMTGVWGEEGYVFPTSIGTFKDHNNLQKLLRKAYPEWKFTFHDLRHWFVSTGIEAGAADVQIARLVGHKSTRTTNDVYGHLLEGGQESIIKSIEEALG